MALRENNNSPVAAGTDYCIIDLEYADTSIGGRFDLVAVKWPSSRRKQTTELGLALIEVKYADGVLRGDAGLEAHLEDFESFVQNRENLAAFKADMAAVFCQKCELGLMNAIAEHKREIAFSDVLPEVVFVFANHNPDSTVLADVLQKVDTERLSFSIRTAGGSAMGYGLYADRLQTVSDFLAQL